MAIRTNTLVDSYELISRYDDAVDVDAPDFEHRWKLYRDGMGEPPLKPGAEPSFIKLRHLSSTERHYLIEKAQEGGALLAAARFALVGIRGLEIDGREFRVEFETLSHGGVKFQVAARKSLDLLPETIQIEIGGVVMDRLQPRPS